MSIRIVAVCLVGAIGCADVPDYDDPREVPVEEGDHVTCQNLLRNGDFEQSSVAWDFRPANVLIDDRQLGTGYPFRASSGYYFAWLGGTNGASRTVSQRIEVPRTSSLELGGKYFVAAETTAGRIEDTLKIEIADDKGAVLATIASFSNLDSVPDGASFIWEDLRTNVLTQAFAGKTVVFRITSVNDAVNNTNFLFDTLELKPTDCL